MSNKGQIHVLKYIVLARELAPCRLVSQSQLVLMPQNKGVYGDFSVDYY